MSNRNAGRVLNKTCQDVNFSLSDAQTNEIHQCCSVTILDSKLDLQGWANPPRNPKSRLHRVAVMSYPEYC